MTQGANGRWQGLGVAALLCLSACTAAIPEPGLRTRADQRPATIPQPPSVYPQAAYAPPPPGAIQSAALGQAYARPGDELLGGPPVPPPPADFSTAPPPPAYAYAPPPPAYAYAAPPPVISSPPVPNPEDMTAQERARVYGAPGAATRATSSTARAARAARSSPVVRPRVAASRPTTAASPSRPVAARQTLPRSPAVGPAQPMPASPPVASRPVPAASSAQTSPAPSIAARPAPATAAGGPAARPATPADRLGQAMSEPLAAGASLTHAAPAAPDQPHTVTLALPSDLFSLLRREAEKLGLGRKAQAADLMATLKGQNYEITPSGPQTLHLQPGKAPTFTWAVKPLKGATGQLSATVEAILKGQGAPTQLSLGAINHRFSELADQVTTQAKGAATGLHVLDIPHVGSINLPGLGDVQSGVVVAGLLVLFLLVLIIAMIRAAQEQRRQKEIARRRRAAARFAADQQMAAEQARHEARVTQDARTLENV